jgi:hypothetical protein
MDRQVNLQGNAEISYVRQTTGNDACPVKRKRIELDMSLLVEDDRSNRSWQKVQAHKPAGMGKHAILVALILFTSWRVRLK